MKRSELEAVGENFEEDRDCDYDGMEMLVFWLLVLFF